MLPKKSKFLHNKPLLLNIAGVFKKSTIFNSTNTAPTNIPEPFRILTIPLSKTIYTILAEHSKKS